MSTLRQKLKKDGRSTGLAELIEKNKGVDERGSPGANRADEEMPPREITEETSSDQYRDGDYIQEIPIGMIAPNPDQPRKSIPEESIRSLSEDIRVRGILQPLVVRVVREGEVYLRAGERRLRAAKLAGLKSVPGIVRNSGDDLEIALIENLLRQDLNPFDEAQGYSDLMRRTGMNQDSVGKMFGRTAGSVSQTIGLLRLPDEIRSTWEGKGVSKRVLIALAAEAKKVAPEEILRIYDDVVEQGVSAEELRQSLSRKKKKKATKKKPTAPFDRVWKFKEYVETRFSAEKVGPRDIDKAIEAVDETISALKKKRRELQSYQKAGGGVTTLTR